jgi:hypothetical protein
MRTAYTATCPDCDGSGAINETRNGFTFIRDADEPCPRCEALGVLRGEEARRVLLGRKISGHGKRPAGFDPVEWSQVKSGRASLERIQGVLVQLGIHEGKGGDDALV